MEVKDIVNHREAQAEFLDSIVRNEINKRMSGKTTRKINEAVEALFKCGYIHIPTKRQIETAVTQTRFGGHNYNPECIIIDADWIISQGVQVELLHKIERRINWEHGAIYEVDNDSNIISLKSDYIKRMHGI